MNFIKCLIVSVSFIVLAGCASKSDSQYPSELQMIIATSGHQNAPQQNVGANANAISVAELLASVKQPNNGSNGSNGKEPTKKANAVKAHPRVPDWVFSGKTRSQQAQQPSYIQQTHYAQPSQDFQSQQALAKALISGKAITQEVDEIEVDEVKVDEVNRQQNKRLNDDLVVATAQLAMARKVAHQPTTNQLKLNYGVNEQLPQKIQLLMAKQIVQRQNAALVKLAIGGSEGLSAMESARQAYDRAKQLIKALATDDQQAKVVYQPKLGNDVVIITFEPRG